MLLMNMEVSQVFEICHCHGLHICCWACHPHPNCQRVHLPDIYFQVNNGDGDDVFQSLTSENNFVVGDFSWQTCMHICMNILIQARI